MGTVIFEQNEIGEMWNGESLEHIAKKLTELRLNGGK